jgi:hypothetical protein
MAAVHEQRPAGHAIAHRAARAAALVGLILVVGHGAVSCWLPLR